MTKANYFNIFLTNETVTKINFDEQLISNLIVALNPNKVHGHEGLSIRMLQMGYDSVSKSLSIIIRHCLKDGYFLTSWKKANVVPVHKKGNKQILNNYRPVSLLPICSKLFEKIIFDTIFQHLTVNKLLNPNQSGFMLGDSCIHPLISFTHEIYSSFDANRSLEVREVIFSRKINKVYHPPLLFNNSTVQQIPSQKHLGIHLDEELTFKHDIDEKINKANKCIGIIRKLNNILPRSALLTISRSFIRPHLDYSDVIYDQPENESFSSKIESFQYNESLSITGTRAIRGTSQEKLHQELGLEFLRSRRWLRRMCCFYKLIKTQKPLYLFNLIPPKLNSLRHPNTYSVMRCRNDYFKNSFITLCSERMEQTEH